MAIKTEESRTGSLTLGFRPTLGEKLFEDVAVRRICLLYSFARCTQDCFDLFSALAGLNGLAFRDIESCCQYEAADRAILSGSSLRQEAMLLRRCANSKRLADCGRRCHTDSMYTLCLQSQLIWLDKIDPPFGNRSLRTNVVSQFGPHDFDLIAGDESFCGEIVRR
jgi:hypothetical protein